MKLIRTKHKEKYRLGWFWKTKRFFGAFGFLWFDTFGIWYQNQSSLRVININLILFYINISYKKS